MVQTPENLSLHPSLRCCNMGFGSLFDSIIFFSNYFKTNLGHIIILESKELDVNLNF